MRELPRDAVIATARVVAVHRTEDLGDHISVDERTFGSYASRFAWELADVTPLAGPASATGMLGLWEWELP